MSTITWPIASLPVLAVPHLVPMSRDGGQAANGVSQIVSPLCSIWTLSFAVSVHDRASALALRTTLDKLKGRFNWLKIAVCDPYWPLPGVSNPTVTLSAAAAKNAETIALAAGANAAAVEPGHFVSIDGYLHRVTDKAGNTCTIVPPLRAAAAGGATVKLRPEIVVRLTDDAAGKLERLKFGTVGIDCIEVLER